MWETKIDRARLYRKTCSFVQPFYGERNCVALYCPRCGDLYAVDISDCLDMSEEAVSEMDAEIRCPNLICDTVWSISFETLYNLYELQQKLCSQHLELKEEYLQESPVNIFIIAITPPY